MGKLTLVSIIAYQSTVIHHGPLIAAVHPPLLIPLIFSILLTILHVGVGHHPLVMHLRDMS